MRFTWDQRSIRFRLLSFYFNKLSPNHGRNFGLETLSGEERFRYWMRHMKRPTHAYLALDTSRPVADCLVDVMAFLPIE